MTERYKEQIYAGVLGKLIGVYLGRPIEGWSYEKIIETFGEIPYYVHTQCGVPLIVADDDISGTFGFFRALEDNGYPQMLTPQMVGEAWRNYIIEDKTILWWGGLGRSTEHTAYLHLKSGIPAPESGSIARNGKTMAEQIGAQIFIDAFAMANPGDPERAAAMVRAAASVSHDGLALDAAAYLGAMQAMAFDERDLNKLLDDNLRFVTDSRLLALIEDVRSICSKESNWRTVRDRLNDKYGYHIYPGCCHMVPNHAMVLASLLLGGDDFQKSIKIAASAAWDTDCNAGNVGALNGIRLGLAGIDAGADLRTPVADLAYVITADGGAVITDAVQQSRAIIAAACALQGEQLPAPQPRYAFEFVGATQGFAPCPYSETPSAGLARLGNQNEAGGENGLLIECHAVAEGAPAAFSTPTFLDFSQIAKNFSTVASPTLYETQTIHAKIELLSAETIAMTPFVLYYDVKNKICRIKGDAVALTKGDNEIDWTIPTTGGMPIFRLGFEISSVRRFDGKIVLRSLDWPGAPKSFCQQGMMMTSIWDTTPYWTQTWASSARHFAADFKYTYCISHNEPDGLATIGTDDWQDYSVSSSLCFAMHRSGGLVARARGHRRYYAAILKDKTHLAIVKRMGDSVTTLAEKPFSYEEDRLYGLELVVQGNHLAMLVDGVEQLTAIDDSYRCGGAGFLVDMGTMTADGFSVCAL